METESWIIAIITIAAGGILGYALPYIVKFIQFMVGLPFRKEILTGTWHSYHFTRMHGQRIVRYERREIKRNLLNRLIVKTEDPKNPHLKYKGHISTERNYLLILLKGVRHKEEIQMRFFDVIPTGQDIAFGLVMGVDFDNEPQSHVQIMSRRELSDEQAEKLLSSKTMFREGILRISRQNTSA